MGVTASAPQKEHSVTTPASAPARPQLVTWAPSQTGPCALCHAPTCKYGVGASPTCPRCAEARAAQYRK
ncbi:hypothetical protein GCM10010260_81880 [Streptomyces filipinensis]|uniref:Uncharacterized protein n=1 Tax=Streptomyces filipinensis TaxID=66887 RepID=A0A918IJU5_9ACTN|nr:hypothetical protein GCM10010260_81880 [Streptomyces filipinensis]